MRHGRFRAIRLLGQSDRIVVYLMTMFAINFLSALRATPFSGVLRSLCDVRLVHKQI